MVRRITSRPVMHQGTRGLSHSRASLQRLTKAAQPLDETGSFSKGTSRHREPPARAHGSEADHNCIRARFAESYPPTLVHSPNTPLGRSGGPTSIRRCRLQRLGVKPAVQSTVGGPPSWSNPTADLTGVGR